MSGDALELFVHHPWCNYFMRPREGCKMCKGLYEKYPIEEGQSVDDLTEKHFPNAIRIR